MLSFGSIAGGTIGLVFSGLLMVATLWPVSAEASPQKIEYATSCTDVLLGFTSPCRVAILA